MTPSAVIFDLDGTLVDSAPAIRAVASAFLATLGAAPLTAEETRAFIGKGAPVFMDRMLAARGIAPGPEERAALYQRYLAIYEAGPGEANTPFPGVPEMLAALTRAGVPLGLCTSKPGGPTRSVLAGLGWQGLFGAVVAGDTLAVRKPDPAPLAHCAALLGADPAGILYVGDSETDRDTAAALGCAFALWPHGYRAGGLESFPGARIIGDWVEIAALAQPSR